ncbi:MAG: hypothetical protein CMC92_02675 [Flavobacteriaceae bacterium]|nr:hypothetical protein [Flavobacteriaceae bacterium]
MKKLNRLFVLIIIFLVNCNDNVNIVQKQEANSKPLSYSEINFDSIYQIKYDSSIEEWINYFELNEFIKQLNTDDFSSLIDNKKFLLRFFKGIKFSIPDEINKPEIKSRLTVIETDFMRFESMLSNYEIDKEIKIKMVKKINNSFSNLNFQIDKLLEKQEINLD